MYDYTVHIYLSQKMDHVVMKMEIYKEIQEPMLKEELKGPKLKCLDCREEVEI